MRDYQGSAFHRLPPEIRNALSPMDYFLRDLSRGIRRIADGEVPDGSGGGLPIGSSADLDDYLYLPGRVGGQVVHGLDDAPAVTIDGAGTGLGVIGSIGNPLFRLAAAGTTMFDLRPYKFDNSTTEVAFTNGSGVGIGINFPSNDGTSALRIASTTNRTYLQAGLKDSSGNVINSNMTIGATGARVMTSLLAEIQRVGFTNASTIAADGTVLTAATSRLGVNSSPDDYASSSIGNQPDAFTAIARAGGSGPAGLFIGNTTGFTVASVTSNGTTNLSSAGGFGRVALGMLVSGGTVPAGTTVTSRSSDSAISVSVSVSAGTATLTFTPQNALEVRTTSSGSSPSLILGAIRGAFGNNGSLRLYESGRLRGQVFTSSTDDTVSLLGSTSLNMMEVQTITRFADTVTTTSLKIGDTLNGMICGGGYNILSRLGISATSVVWGPANSITLPAPLSSRILTIVNSAGTVLSGFDSAGAYFLVTGGAAGRVYTSDANGVGSWSALSGLSSAEFLDSAFRVIGSSDATKKLAFEVDGFSAGSTTRTMTVPDANGTLALLESTQTWTGVNTFDRAGTGYVITIDPDSGTYPVEIVTSAASRIFAMDAADDTLNVFGFNFWPSGSVGTGSKASFVTAALSADRTYTFPNATGTVALLTATQTMTAKTMGNSNSYQMSTASGGFADSTTTTKIVRFGLSGMTASVTSSELWVDTVARTRTRPNVTGQYVIVGDDPPAVAAGALGKVDLTAQTAAIGSTNLTNTALTGIYRIDVYAECTTLSGSGAPTLDVNIAWTDDVGATNRNVTAEPGATGFPLPLSATGRSSASLLVYVASGEIAYTTTINAASGSPQYAIRIRVTYLG